jgi:transcriptional regulator with XRE-family HTH domain
MAEVIGLGRKRPNGSKITELRKQRGLKQSDLADRVHISERTLREIERSNHPIPATTITAIATELKVSQDQIILSTTQEDFDLEDAITQEDLKNKDGRLELRGVRSGRALSLLAEEAHRSHWDVIVDPTAATAKEMQQLLKIIRRVVDERFSDVRDEFDGEDATGGREEFPNDFRYIARLARLQELLDALWANGVGLLAASYYQNSWTNREDKSLGIKVGIPGTEQVWMTQSILEIRFVPSDVDVTVLSIDTGRPWKELQELLERPGVRSAVVDELRNKFNK